jgi:hypothetical protein
MANTPRLIILIGLDEGATVLLQRVAACGNMTCKAVNKY